MQLLKGGQNASNPGSWHHDGTAPNSSGLEPPGYIGQGFWGGLVREGFLKVSHLSHTSRLQKFTMYMYAAFLDAQRGRHWPQ